MLTTDQLTSLLGRTPTDIETQQYQDAPLQAVATYAQAQKTQAEADALSQQRTEAEQQYNDIQSQIDNALTNKRAEVARSGGIVDESQLRREVASEVEPLIIQQKGLSTNLSSLRSAEQQSKSQALKLQQLGQTYQLGSQKTQSSEDIAAARIQATAEQNQQKQQVTQQSNTLKAIISAIQAGSLTLPPDQLTQIEQENNLPEGTLSKMTVKESTAISAARYGITTSNTTGNTYINSPSGLYYDISTYASDPKFAQKIQTIVDQIGKLSTVQDIDNAIQKLNPNSQITSDMIVKAADKYGVGWEELLAIMQNESNLGTSPVSKIANNFGGVKWMSDVKTGATNSGITGDDGGTYAKFATLQDGVDAVAQQLQKREISADDFKSVQESGKTNAQLIADAIISGKQPPTTTGLYGQSAAVKAELQRQGFNLSQAVLEWTATQKWVSSANSTTQLRLRQAISSVKQGIEGLRSASQEWNAGGFAPLNSVNMKLALDGALGSTPEERQKAQSTAAKFKLQATIITDELGQTFMGGNSPTDRALELAGGVLNTNWSQQTLDDALTSLDTNLGYRMNAIESTGAITSSGTNPYATGSTQSGTTSMTGPDGSQWDVPNDQVNLFKQNGYK